MTPVVDAARGWLGTPYVHQAACKGAGCDCLGLVIGLWREMYGALPVAVPAYTADWSEVSGAERLWAAAIEHLEPKPLQNAAPGDVLLFRMRPGAVAKHIGVQTEIGATPRFLHAYTGHGVTEGALTPPWARRVVARFAFPERT